RCGGRRRRGRVGQRRGATDGPGAQPRGRSGRTGGGRRAGLGLLHDPAGAPTARLDAERTLVAARAAQVGEPAELLLAGPLFGLAPAPPALAGLVAHVAPHYYSPAASSSRATVSRVSPAPADRTTVRNFATRSTSARSAPCPVGR